MIDPLPNTRSNHVGRHAWANRADMLFAEILNNDVVNLDTPLPARIDLRYAKEQLEDGFRLSCELWNRDLDRKEIVRVANKLFQDQWIDQADRLIFKHVRARFKHLRFAFAIFGDRHRYPLCLDAVTSVMGNLQDAFKNDRKSSVRRNALLLRILLSRQTLDLVIRETTAFRQTTPENFRSYLRHQSVEIREFLENREVSAKQFHDTRKVISRYRACFATLVTTAPNENNFQAAAFIATINGLMGNFHDILMAEKLNGTRDYRRDRFTMQDEIRQRLQKLVASVH